MCTHPCDRKSQGEREGEEVKARRERAIKKQVHCGKLVWTK